MGILFFFFNDTATTEIYTLSLHDALPIYWFGVIVDTGNFQGGDPYEEIGRVAPFAVDRKSTRLNSSHLVISYAVFCLKKKNRSRLAVPIRTETHQQQRAHSRVSSATRNSH